MCRRQVIGGTVTLLSLLYLCAVMESNFIGDISTEKMLIQAVICFIVMYLGARYGKLKEIKEESKCKKIL